MLISVLSLALVGVLIAMAIRDGRTYFADALKVIALLLAAVVFGLLAASIH